MDQTAYFDNNQDLAYERLLQLMMDQRHLVAAKARFLLQCDIYAFTADSWNRTPEEVLEEVLGKLAEAQIWQVIRQKVEEEAVWEQPQVIFEPDPALIRALEGGPDD